MKSLHTHLKSLNIRMKLLLVFMTLFTILFTFIFIFFYFFAVRITMDNLRADLTHSASIAAALIDAAEYDALVQSGTEEDARYMRIAEDLMTVYDSNENIYDIYTMVSSPNPNEMLYIIDLAIVYPEEIYGDDIFEEDEDATAEDDDGTFIGTAYDISNLPELLEGCNAPAADRKINHDEYGDWLSAYAPIPGSSDPCAIVGVDMDVSDVNVLRGQILLGALIAFVLSFGISFAAVYFLSGAMTQPLSLITAAAESLEQGEAFEAGQLAEVTDDQDEIGNLARVFSRMAQQVQARQKELEATVTNLRVEIDDIKRQSQVSEITANPEFQELKEKVRAMRQARKNENSGG